MAKKKIKPNEWSNSIKRKYFAFRAGIEDSKVEIGIIAKAHFDANFEKEGFVDSTLKLWPKRSPDRRPHQKTLQKTTKLKNDNKYYRIRDGIRIVNSTYYAGYHNYGIGQKTRKFIGDSAQLNLKINRIIREKIRYNLKLS